jgi:hypothetical protein
MTVIETLNELECAGCHMVFAITAGFMASRRDDHKSFYCPSGCSNHYSGKSEAEKLRDRVAALEQQKQWESERAARNHQAYIDAERRVRAQRGLVTRIKNRVHNGVCPDCKRSFANLRRHMATKHSQAAQ